jgi:hypothetical protein
MRTTYKTAYIAYQLQIAALSIAELMMIKELQIANHDALYTLSINLHRTGRRLVWPG